MMTRRSPFAFAASLAAVVFSLAAHGATISGNVLNGTVNKPSAGDDVVLLNLQQGLSEAARTKTDSKGHYTLQAPDDNMPHLMRVEHQKGSYFKNIPPGVNNVDISVYDVAAKVEGIATDADVIRLEIANGQLKVTENFFLRNNSKPPRTQLSEHTFELFLPADAVIEASAAMAPSGMPVSSSPVPQGEKGHYAFAFPIRPNDGESGTRFQLSYHLPYTGSYTFTPKISQKTDNIAVLIPKSMQFQQAAGTPWQPVQDELNAQTFLAKNVDANTKLSFTVSGEGSMPRELQTSPTGADGGAPPVGAAAGAEDTRPGGGLGNPIDTPDPLSKYKWWILGGLSVLLAIAAGFFLRKPALPPTALPPASPEPTTAPIDQQTTLLAALKDELFALETERMEGKLTEDDYTRMKTALEMVLKRTLSRK